MLNGEDPVEGLLHNLRYNIKDRVYLNDEILCWFISSSSLKTILKGFFIYWSFFFSIENWVFNLHSRSCSDTVRARKMSRFRLGC